MVVMAKKRSRFRLTVAFLAAVILVLAVVGWRFGVLGCMLAGGSCRSLPIENKADLVGRLSWILFQRWFLEPLQADSYEPIFLLDDLADLYPRSVATRPFVHEILVDPYLSLPVKELAVRVSQCLPLSDYIDFLAQTYADWKSGHLPDEILDTVITPGNTWGINLDVAYQDARVRSLLTTIAEDPAINPDMRDTITNYMLNGVEAEMIKEYAGNGWTPILSCGGQAEK